MPDRRWRIDAGDASIHALTVAVLLTAGAFVWLSARSMAEYRFTQNTIRRSNRLEHLSGDVLRLDEVLTMSALMAATTGNQRWVTRYRGAEPELDEVFAELRSLLRPSSGAHAAFAQSDSANEWLVEQENRALELAGAGELEQARAIILSTAYDEQKARYVGGVSELNRQLVVEAEADRATYGRRALLSIVTTALVLILLVAGWVLVLRMVRRREALMVNANAHLAQKTRELAELNSQLDTWVLDRTAELEAMHEELLRAAMHAEATARELTGTNEQLQIEIAERRAAEDEASASEARYRRLFDDAIFGIYRTTVDGHVELANPAFVAMLGYDSEDEVRGLDMGRDVYEDPRERDRLVREHRNADSIPPVEVDWKRKAGDAITVRLTGRAIRGADGQPVAYEMLAEDVTERKKLGEHVRQVQKMESLGRLAGGVAHDFNNLLTVILAETALALQAGEQDTQSRNAFGQVQAAAERAAVLTRQLLTFSRRQAIEPIVLTSNDVVTSMEPMFSRLLGEDVRLTLRLATDPGAVRADRGQMEQVILNLVLNARDALHGTGTITVETAGVHLPQGHALAEAGILPGLYCTITVSDTGMGMNDETKQRLFEPFYTTKEAGRGTGLGLATVFAIVQQSGGHITVYSELDVGTTMRVYLPTVDEAAQEAAMPDAPLPKGAGETILIVEDEPSVRSVTTRILTRLGYKVVEAADGPSGLAMLQATSDVALLLTDVILPGMRGREVAERAVAMRPDLRVLYASGYTDDVVLEQQLLDSDVSLINKPFTIEALAMKVREVLAA